MKAQKVECKIVMSNDKSFFVVANFEKELLEAINFEVVAGLLVEQGWYRIELYPVPTITKKWCKENLKHNYKRKNGIWLFESKADAEWFSLRWS